MTIFLRLRWLNLSGALLAALLQRTPVVRALVVAEESVLASRAGALLKSTVAALGALGAVHTLAGATQLVVSATTVNGTVGTALNPGVGFSTTGAPSPAGSYTFSGSLPPGVVVPGAVNNTINAQNGVIVGTPTAAGTFDFNITAWELASGQGGSEGPARVRFIIVGGATAPTISAQPQAKSAATGDTVTFTVTAAGSPAPTFQWRKDGANIIGATSATLTLSNVTVASNGNYSVVVTNSAGTVTSSAAALSVAPPGGPPSISAQPTNQATVVGQPVSFTVTATGSPSPTYQWFKNGLPITGATGATYGIASAVLTDAGNYFVNVTNTQGTVPSATVTLTVDATASKPVFAAQGQPTSQTMTPGGTVVFGVQVSGSPAPNYQWQRGGAAIGGATNASLVIKNAGAADAGSYTCVATNSAGTLQSAAATLTLVPTGNPGRLINLSIITPLAAAEIMSMGTVLGGTNTSGAAAVLARAAGPSLGAFGVPGTLPDPKMALVATGGGKNTVVATNDNWNGAQALADAFVQVGAFPYANATTKDAAVIQRSLPADGYAVQVSDAGTGVGTVLAELYDASVIATAPRLINVSVIKRIETGKDLSAGFVIRGDTSKTVLVRAIGPGLAAFGISDRMADPKLELVVANTGALIATNDNWGGQGALSDAGTAVGAFAIANAASADAMLLVTLPPGSYAARVQPNGAGGSALVEVYDVP